MQSKTLRYYRNAQNLKQKTVADFLGMSQSNYSNLENDKIRLAAQYPPLLADLYGVGKEIFLTAEVDQAYPPTIQPTNMLPVVDNNEIWEDNQMEPILWRIDNLLNLLADEKEELATERKQLASVFNQLVSKFGICL